MNKTLVNKSQKIYVPSLSDLPWSMTVSPLFLALKNHSEVLLRYLYSMAKSLARIGPAGNLQNKDKD